MYSGPLASLALQEASILNEVQVMRKRSERGEQVWAREVTAMLKRYGTSFDDLPPHLRAAIDEIDLAD